MGDVIQNTRFRRVTARERAKLRARFALRRPWEMQHDKAMAEFDRIVAEARKARPTRRR